MSRSTILVMLCLLVSVGARAVPLPVNPLVNGDFDAAAGPGAPPELRGVLDVCFGVGHQALIPLYSPWGDDVIEAANAVLAGDAETAVARVSDPYFAQYPQDYAAGYAADPASAALCDPGYQDVAEVNAWEKTQDEAPMWSNDPGTRFADFDGDGDREAIIPSAPVEHSHNLWQSVATATQAFSADFAAFEFTVEAGAIPASASNQIGLALSPGYMQHPWLGAFWEGAIVFTSADMAPDASGRVRMDPVAQGSITCPAGYTPCLSFRDAWGAADDAGKRTLLGQARVIQTSFWAFSHAAGPVVIDDVAYVGAQVALSGGLNPNPG